MVLAVTGNYLNFEGIIMNQPLTYLFSAFDAHSKNNESFVQDLNSFFLLWFDTKNQSLLKKYFLQETLAVTNLQSKRIIEEFAKTANVAYTTIQSAFSCALFFLRNMDKEETKGDTPEALAKDLVRLQLLEPTQEEVASTFFKWIVQEIIPKAHSQRLERESASAIFPCFTGISTTVELRSVQETSYDTLKPVAKYEPEILGVVPVFAVEIRTTGDKFAFNADRENIERLITSLQASLKDMDALKRRLATA